MQVNEIIKSYVDEVIRRLPRKQRNDVGFELRALLQEELQGRADAAGRAPDEAMVMEMLGAFGQPEDVAARYNPRGFELIERGASPAFVYIAVTGVAIQWTFGLIHIFARAQSFDEGAMGVARWWTSGGLGALWWPGFLIVCFAIGAWVRRRWPSVGAWRPAAHDRDHANRFWTLVAMVFFAIGAGLLIALPWASEALLPAKAAPAFRFDPTFLTWRAPFVLPFWTVGFIMLGIVLVEGRWRTLTRRIELVTNLAGCALMGWWLTGDIFISRVANDTTKAGIGLVLFFMLIDIGVKLYRLQARITPPRVPSVAL